MKSRLKEMIFIVTGAALILHSRTLLAIGRRRPVDGYRRAAGLLLRQKSASFVLSAFGLKPLPRNVQDRHLQPDAAQEEIALRLSAFLSVEPVAHAAIVCGHHEDRSERCGGASYTLGFSDWIDGPRRFISPDDWTGSDLREPGSLGPPLLNIICRVSSEGCADIWLRVNHVGADGEPIQNMLSRLESAWGTETVIYPSPEEFRPFEKPRRCEGGELRNLAEMQIFIDLNPLLMWRRSRNARLAVPLTLSAALLWCLARQQRLATLHMATTVAVPEANGLNPGVGMVVIRPADYLHKRDGLAKYAREFNRQLELTRRRSGLIFKTLDAAAHIPAHYAAAVLRWAVGRRRLFGSIGLTVLRDARVFGVPLGDAGHVDGFFALGSIDLPTSDGRKVGCITIKGPAHIIRDYPELLRQAISSLLIEINAE